MSSQESPGGATQCALPKTTVLSLLMLAVGGLTLPLTLRSAATTVQQVTGDITRIAWGACSVSCGNRCALQPHMWDDEVVYVGTDNTSDSYHGNHQIHACLHGCFTRRRISYPDRLNCPVKHVNKRGEGKFGHISWQEVLDILVDRLKSAAVQYGNEAVYINYSSGVADDSVIRLSLSASPVVWLMSCCGGSLDQYGAYSTTQIAYAMPYAYGSNGSNGTSDIENSKLAVTFDNNPTGARMSGDSII